MAVRCRRAFRNDDKIQVCRSWSTTAYCTSSGSYLSQKLLSFHTVCIRNDYDIVHFVYGHQIGTAYFIRIVTKQNKWINCKVNITTPKTRLHCRTRPFLVPIFSRKISNTNSELLEYCRQANAFFLWKRRKKKLYYCHYKYPRVKNWEKKFRLQWEMLTYPECGEFTLFFDKK